MNDEERQMTEMPGKSSWQMKAEDLERQLRAEREKVHCRACNGRGRIIDDVGYRSSNSQCFKCNGEGKHKP